MASLRRLFLRLYHVIRPGAGDVELDRELASHLALIEEEYRRRGLTPEAARREAQRAMGGVAQVKDGQRDARSVRWLDDLWHDLRFGARLLVRAPGFTLVVVLTLALGLGANSAIFTVVNGLLFRSVPVPHPEALLRLRWSGPNSLDHHGGSYGYSAKDAAGERVEPLFSYAAYQALRASNRTLTGIAAFAPNGDLNVVVDGTAELASSEVVSGNYFRVLEVPVVRGRPLTPEDDRQGAAPVALISYRYWARRFALDAGVVGRVVTINNVRVTVVGVTPKDFNGVQGADEVAKDVTLPLAWAAQSPQSSSRELVNNPTSWLLQIMGRLQPGATLAQVRGNLEGVFQHVVLDGPHSAPASAPSPRPTPPRLEVASGQRGVYDTNPKYIGTASLLGAVVGIVLLIACANVANLLLSRAAARQHEIAVRLSIGATRSRLIRQLLAESLLLSATGGLVGFVVGYWTLQFLSGGGAVPIDWRVVAFSAGLTALTSIACGVGPALRATRVDHSTPLKETSRSVRRTRTRLGASLLVIQVALSLSLLVGAGLFLRTLANLHDVDVGFSAGHLALFSVNPGLNGYDAGHVGALYDDIKRVVRAVPGVRSVSFSDSALLAGVSNTSSIVISGRPGDGPREARVSDMHVSPEFFATAGIPVLMGRAFEARDMADKAPQVAVINETAARTYFPGDDPVGRRYRESVEEVEIVGIIRDTKYDSVRAPTPPMAYRTFPHDSVQSATFEVLTTGDPSAILPDVREAVQRADPNLPIMRLTTQTQEMEQRLSEEHLLATSYSLFAVLALLLASVGLFAVMATSVARRTGEIGIRMALGANRRQVVRMVLGESMVTVAIGVLLGLALALGGGRLIASLLFGLSPSDPVTVTAALGTMVVVSLLAGYLPARRAAHVDPLTALRQD